MAELISVIVTAYRRRQYLGESLRSVLSQTLDRRSYEVVVVSDFEPGMADLKGISWVYDDQEGVGEKVRKGFVETRGGIVCLLDDDDMFRGDKLERVISMFRDLRPLYYHNSFVTVDERGNEIRLTKDYLKVPPYASLNPPEFTLTLEDAPLTRIRNLLKLNANFNSSSICVRREVLEASLDYLKRVKAVVDSFLFYSSITQKGRVLLDPERLTYYRIHKLQTSSGNSNGLAEYRESLSRLFLKAYEDMLIVREMSKGISKELDEVIEEEIERYRLLYKLFSGKSLHGTFKPRLLKYYILAGLPSFFKNFFIKEQYKRRANPSFSYARPQIKPS